MKQFWKKSPDQLTTTLAQLQLRAAALADKRAAAEAALDATTEARQSHRLAGDLTDERLDSKLQSNVDLCRSKLTGLDADIAALQAKITDTEQQLASERAAVERTAASEALARDLAAVEKQLPTYLNAARQFARALDELHFHFESGQMSSFVTNQATQVELASAFVFNELRGMVTGIADGTAPIPAEKPVDAPITVEPVPPVVSAEVPVTYSPIRASSPTFRGAVERSEKLDRALAEAGFRVVDRSAENRTISVSIPRF